MKKCKEFKDVNPSKVKKYKTNYYKKNRIKCIKQVQVYRKNNLSKIKEYNKNYYHSKSEDIQFKIAHNLRARFYIALKRKSKKGSAVKDLGCTIKEFKVHLENMFTKGMTWDNYGRGIEKWNIDHIISLSRFDLTKRDEFLKAVHYSNLQPMWALDNISKGNR